MRRWKQDRYFDSGEVGNPHPGYGGCDGFGPDGTCCECTGLYGHQDGSVSDGKGNVYRKAPLLLRIRRAWQALRQASRAIRLG